MSFHGAAYNSNEIKRMSFNGAAYNMKALGSVTASALLDFDCAGV